ncbi:MAG: cytochrome P460 family protein, partial [Bradyrhizobium sp.]|nr:cytochrome P460 family protein [Bradyrhizobium sp.]
IFVKELQLMQPATHPDGSRTEPSGKGFFPGAFNGADVTVKDSERYKATNGWGYYNFNHHEPKAATAKVRPIEECAYCHIASAKRDDVWTQFYVLLDQVPVPVLHRSYGRVSCFAARSQPARPCAGTTC